MLSWNEAREYIELEEMCELLRKIIRIPSIGSRESEVAYEIIDLLEEEGIKEYKLLESEEGRGNLIIDVKGRSEGFNLLFIGHSDVVPPGEGWSINPFSGEERDGYIYGRGAIDDKSQIVVYTYLAVLLNRLGRDFRGRIRILIAADEELQNPNHGVRYLIKEHPYIFKGIHGAIGELGGLVSIGGRKAQAIIIGEKGSVSHKVMLKGRGRHSSLVGEDDLIKIGSEFLLRLPRKIYFVSETFKNALKDAFGWKRHLIFNRLLSKHLMNNDPILNMYIQALSHITIASTIVRAGEAHNVIPDRMEIIINARIFPEQNESWVRRLIEKTLSRITKNNYDILLQTYVPATLSTTDNLLYKKIVKTIREMNYTPLPLIQVGSSDSAWVRSLGIPVYHFFTTTKELEIDRIHGADERIWKKDLLKALEGYYRLITNIQ